MAEIDIENLPQPTTNKQLQLYKLAHDYLIDNFHKFTESNKIKVSLVIVSKYIPTKIEGGLNFNKMPEVILDDKKQDLNFGSNIT